MCAPLSRLPASRAPPFSLGFFFFVSDVVWRVTQAVEVAKSAIADIQQPPEQDVGTGDGEEKEKEKAAEGGGEEDERRKAALDKLENASEDSLLGQASCTTTFAVPFSSAMPAMGSDGFGDSGG